MASTAFNNPNIILYGPPGTGKTRQTLELAYEILTGKPAPTYEAAQQLFRQELGQRIEFITFHQSFTYEDFVQGFRPKLVDGQMVFEQSNGVFYRIADRARKELTTHNASDKAISYIDHQAKNAENNELISMPFEEAIELLIQMAVNSNGIIQIPRERTSFPVSVNKNSKSVQFRRGQQGDYRNIPFLTLKKRYEQRHKVANPTGTLKYYDFIVEYLWKLAKEKNKRGLIDPTANTIIPNPPRNYVLIIDEINRANIARVFGELITLLEKDKRLGGDNTLPVTLPSGETGFTVPANLYIIGTMNTADRSLALLDIALRRRFEFCPLYPRYDILPTADNRASVLQMLNQVIVARKSRDFQIGHAYFLDPQETLPAIFNNKVIPLLYEYFLNDEKRVQEILQEAGIPSYVDPIAGLRFGEANASA